ncbi:hypothetical protein [Catalinimonas niigatensis]|uniref:hypothetical protein n=1 Tax=Catalinimonas niigatensis TaxID=1397264 RepID=UPI002665231E|nr:hypothetical protein [Catalinimonas niigatensis]WPP50122.1 hypothetical protein PZB72_26000 [Catalinimonas niigatensis]
MANHKQDNHSAFEDQWKDAFEDVEITPSANLWKNIDNQLTMQESGKYRKGFFFYRTVAAACILCLLGLGYYVLQDSIEKGNQELVNQPIQEETSPSEQAKEAPKDLALGEDRLQPEADKKDTQNLNNAQKEVLDNAIAQEKVNSDSRTRTSEGEANQKEALKSSQMNDNAALSSQGISNSSGIHNDNTSAHATLTDAKKDKFVLAYVSPMGPELTEEQISNWTNDIRSLYRVPQVVIDGRESEQKPEFFAGLNLATNYFDPNFSAGNNGNFAALRPNSDFTEVGNLGQDLYSMSSRNTPANSGLENKPQLSLSYGVDVGFMLTKHLSLESGLDYGRMNSKTQTSWIAEDFGQGERIPVLVSNTSLLSRSANTFNSSQFTPQEQELTNSFAFLSVPLKLGYNLGFERINLNLSSGVAANFFINNRLSDESGQLSTVNISTDSGSPYRPVYYSGVISGGVNYLIASNYALSVSPNYNFSLSALTENGNSFSSQPNAFGVDFGIRYNFR